MITPKRAERVMTKGVDENGECTQEGEDPYDPYL